MSRTDHHSGEAPHGEHQKRRKNKYKPKKDNRFRRSNLPSKQELREEHIYIPPRASNKDETANQIETYDPARPFALAPCQACGFTVCDDKTTCKDHESPIIITVSSRGKSPTACGVFCNINSIYNTTFMLHDENLVRMEADLHAAVAALKQVQAFINIKTKRDSLQSKRITQIIIKTNSNWLGKGFAGSTDHYRYRKLSLEFDNLVDELGEHSGVRPVVKFWKVHGCNMAQQLADSTLRGWEEVSA
jgi:hypothetical protein